ncbi:hypothetical protein Kpol_359p10 [Vanderwaltozyma polyspora DSM 70294]|uniref:Telomere length regulation protein conserved domain-containing protein n=1 Tax=Vanderwaltozyma polyspora (strain ATCC 22028 / DSM 70294 / BCRC 21397 / CBS 2163 / NBRC 10782 / NRRL Y-8283 / UCD 57-17) TaxID=436907 RepID=A7TSB2_VANPO|nr:uncharacterized protein Kpol_359p10 [Vanderwaltozyma polyspora DSM 70294]EDO14849.1 hypothetical protein Kpol_359p10 [Vanderwaltozyma polyspora DSM 70294]
MVLNVVQDVKKNPDSTNIEILLKELTIDELDLETIMVLITVVVPVYSSLHIREQQKLMVLISKSFTFLAQLVSFGNTIDVINPERNLFVNLLIELLIKYPNCLYNYSIDAINSKEKRNFIISMLFGSKLFNFISKKVDIVDYLNILSTQLKYILENDSNKLIESPCFGHYLVAFFSLNPILGLDILIQDLFLSEETYFELFIKIVNNSTRLDQKRIVGKFLISYLDSKTHSGNYLEVAKILEKFNLHKVIDLQLLLSLKSTALQETIIKLLPVVLIISFSTGLLERFDALDESNDESICQLFTILLKVKLDSNQRDKIANGSKFLNAVTKRLGHQDRLIRERTMYIAKLVSNNQLQYESDFIIDIPDLSFDDVQNSIDFTKLNSNVNKEKIDFELVPRTADQFKQMSLEFDSDDDDEDEIDGRIRFVFLKDIVQEFEKIDKTKRENLVELLQIVVKLVRQKKDFEMEVNFYAPSLLANVACLNNNFDEKKFEEWRINAMVSIIVTSPDNIKELFNLLFTKELSLQQRMSIVSSIGLASRELRGFDDPYVAKPEYDFPTSKLPWHTNYEMNVIEDITKDSQQIIKEKETTWRSQKLNKSKIKPNRNRFQKYARSFFYPLTNGWLNGIDMGSFDVLFKIHYFSTVQMVYHCAFPVYDYENMTYMFNNIVEDALKQNLPIEKYLILNSQNPKE